MGDHRANIKLEMDFHDKKYKTEMNINYCDDFNGVDQRVITFFEESYADGIRRYNAAIDKYSQEKRLKNQETEEKELLAKLKSKYEK